MANYIDYQTYLQSAEWRKKRETVLIFWHYRCALCHSTKNVEVHHNDYSRLGHELLTDLIPLCEVCHERHGNFIRGGTPEPIKNVIECVTRAMR